MNAAAVIEAYRQRCAERMLRGEFRQRSVEDHSGSSTPLVADFSHNDYLGLSRHPAVLAAAQAAVVQGGAGATGARLLSGNSVLQLHFEHQLATDKGAEAALIFNSGYQANATALSALLDARVLGSVPQVFADRLNHASLHHACRLAGVRQQRYRHNDLNHLEQLLIARAPTAPAIIVTETVFGMDGDRVDIERLQRLAEQHQALLYLDDAHATGVFGSSGYGLGRCETPYTIVMGTFSKALGASGAYVAAAQSVIDYLVNHCTGFLYSTAPAPAAVAAAQAAWQLLPSLQAERHHLLSTAAALRNTLTGLGYNVGAGDTPIIPLLIGATPAAVSLQTHLRLQGIAVSLVRPPTVPPDTSRLRIALSTLHTPAQIEALVSALQNARPAP